MSETTILMPQHKSVTADPVGGSAPSRRSSRFAVSSKEQIGIGLIGCGHWGPNHVRIFSQLADSRVHVVADADARRLDAIRRQFQTIETSASSEAVLEHPQVD